MTDPTAPAEGVLPTDPEAARRYDDVIEEAAREERAADLRGDARDALTRLDAGGRDTVRALIHLARWIDAAMRSDEGFDEHEDSLDLIDEATAYCDAQPVADAPVRTDGEIVLGTDFRGLTASAGAVGEAFEVHARDEGAQVWLAFPTAPGSREHVALGSMTIADDGRIILVAAGIPTAIAQATS